LSKDFILDNLLLVDTLYISDADLKSSLFSRHPVNSNFRVVRQQHKILKYSL